MLLKIPKDRCNIVFEDSLNSDVIAENDSYKISSGNIDQYIIDRDGKLVGVVSSQDILNNRGVNYNPIYIVKNRWEMEMADAIFKQSAFVNSIPIVDDKKKLEYAYCKPNSAYLPFLRCEKNKKDWEYVEIAKNIYEEVTNKFKKRKNYIVTDMKIDWAILKDKIVYIEDVKETDFEDSCVLLIYKYEFNCMECLEYLYKKKILVYPCNIEQKDVVAEVVPYYKTDEAAFETLTEISYYNSTYFDLFDFQNIFQVIQMTSNIRGDYVEIGTYRGDSARAALLYMDKANVKRKSYFLDTYEGFCYESAEMSSDCLWAGTHTDTSCGYVEKILNQFDNYHLIKANIIEEDLPEEIQEIAICNIDVDMYEAIKAALNKVKNKIVQGGVIIAEDYGHTPNLIGGMLAIKEFYRENADEFYGLYMQSGQFIMIRSNCSEPPASLT